MPHQKSATHSNQRQCSGQWREVNGWLGSGFVYGTAFSHETDFKFFYETPWDLVPFLPQSFSYSFFFLFFLSCFFLIYCSSLSLIFFLLRNNDQFNCYSSNKIPMYFQKTEEQIKLFDICSHILVSCYCHQSSRLATYQTFLYFIPK